MLLGWLQLVLVLAAAGVAAGALGAALGYRRWLRRLESVAPEQRFWLLAAIGLLPAAGGALLVAVSFAPSLLDALGLVADHCAHHGGHAFHLCFVHGSPPDVSPVVSGVSLAALLWPFAGWLSEAANVRRLRVWKKQLAQLARFEEDVDGWLFDSERPVAVTVGLLKPTVYVSKKLREVLPDPQFRAVVAHEKAHARRFDSLIKLSVRLCARFHVEPVRERLLEELDLACEQACDEAAAEDVGDRLAVAEAILAVERASGADELPASALAFGAPPIERRVKGMLDDQWRSPSWLLVGAGVAGFIAGLAAYYDVLHHTAETLLARLL